MASFLANSAYTASVHIASIIPTVTVGQYARISITQGNISHLYYYKQRNSAAYLDFYSIAHDFNENFSPLFVAGECSTDRYGLTCANVADIKPITSGYRNRIWYRSDLEAPQISFDNDLPFSQSSLLPYDEVLKVLNSSAVQTAAASPPQIYYSSIFGFSSYSELLQLLPIVLAFFAVCLAIRLLVRAIGL